jgi:hypothetical protein
MIQRIKNLFSNYRENRRRKQTLKLIKKAKNLYLEGVSDFMCICFYKASGSFFLYEDLVKVIPEFTPSTFGVNSSAIGGWWNRNDKISRINAFDKLIEIYSK